MSRFNTTKVLLKTAPEISPVAVALPAIVRPKMILEPASSDVSLVQRAGFILMCIFVLSGYANEFAMQYFHVKAYISTVSWVVLPVLLALSGNLMRGLRDVTGRLWLLFLACVLVAVPFSVWRGGSVELVANYIPRAWIFLFYYAAFLVSFGHCRRFLYFLIGANCLLLLDCFLFGGVHDGRFELPKSLFFTNANDLALQLLIGVTQFVYLLYQPQIWKHVVGTAGILISFVYLLRTGSRGAFLATLALVLVTVAFGRNRRRFLMAGVPVAIAAALLVPSGAFHRLTLIEVDPQIGKARDALEISAVGSEIQRMALLRQSIFVAITHPLVGVGPGEFAVAAVGESMKEGTRPNWVGTHNSYTQVASECGIPALLLYVSVIGVTMVSNFRIFRRTQKLAESSDLNAMAFCFFCATLVYAICTFFFHIAYGSFLPAIAGMTVALRLATNPVLWRHTARLVG